MTSSNIIIGESKIRVDKATGFICVTDIGNAKDPGGGGDHVGNWLRNANTIDFIEAWEKTHNPGFNSVEFDGVKSRAGRNAFRIGAAELSELGVSGIIAKRGRYGGTYCTMDWTIHFANWLDPYFYVNTIDAFRKMSVRFHGKAELYQRFSREIAAENYGLITQANSKRKIPRAPDTQTSSKKGGNTKALVQRRLNQVDADIINLAIWDMTASQWRAKFPNKIKGGKNLRDYATPVELKVLNTLQIIMRQLQEDQYTSEEKLSRLKSKATEMITFYCKLPEAVEELKHHREKRGW